MGRSAAWVMAVGLAACPASSDDTGEDRGASDEDPTTDTPGGGAPKDTGKGSGTISYTDDVAPIFAARCTLCHNSDVYLNLSAETSGLALTTQAPSAPCEDPSGGPPIDRPFVVPGDPEASMLWIKLSTITVECGREMPPGTGPLTMIAPDEADVVKQWILEGAKLD